MGPLFRRVNISSSESPALPPRQSQRTSKVGSDGSVTLRGALKKPLFDSTRRTKGEEAASLSFERALRFCRRRFFPLEERRASLVPTPGENIFNHLADALFSADNGRGRMQEWLSNLQTCLHKAEACFFRPRRRRRRQAAARWGCKPLILAVSWSGTCVEIICDSGQRVSCGGRAAAPHLAHTSAPN